MQDKLSFDKKRIKELKQLRSQISNWIWDNCFDHKTGKLTQHPDTDAQDATNFLFPLVQFLDKDKEMTKTIIENTRKELCFDDVFVYRYRNNDGLDGDEGAFILCSYWLISALAKIGKSKQAQSLFEKLENQFSNSGLFSEEINPKDGTYLGNFPQAFSHMGYIMSAYYIQKYHPGNGT